SPLSLNRYSYAEDNPVTFNDPTGNMIAYYGGAPPRPSPAPAPTPAPAPSVPHLPAPNPRRPFNGVSGAPTPAKGPGYWNWLFSQPLLLTTLIPTLAGDVATIIDPALHGIFLDIARTASLIGSLASDISSLFEAFMKQDLSGAVGRLATFAWDFLRALIIKASWSQKFWIGIGLAVVGLGDVPTEGGVSEVLYTVGTFQLATDLSLFFATTLSQYNSKYPNS
ncbi:MAG: hypothetical protein ACRECH_07555, partial [Nitrososphaerales archaeon]